LVLELDDYKMQSASKRLAHKGDKFILVEKKQKDQNDEDYDPVVPYYYSPLLEDCASLYPDIQVFFMTARFISDIAGCAKRLNWSTTCFWWRVTAGDQRNI